MMVTVNRIAHGFIVTESRDGMLGYPDGSPTFCASVDETLKFLRKVLGRRPERQARPARSDPILGPMSESLGLSEEKIRKAMRKNLHDAAEAAESEGWKGEAEDAE